MSNSNMSSEQQDDPLPPPKEGMRSPKEPHRTPSAGLDPPEERHHSPSKVLDTSSQCSSTGGYTVTAVNTRRNLLSREGSTRVIRTSNNVDMETGEVGARECHVQEVTSHLDAMDPNQRLWKKFQSRLGIVVEEGGADESGGDDVVAVVAPKQYRLKTVRPTTRKNWIHKITGTGPELEENDSEFASYNLLVQYLHWTFRTSYVMLMISSAVAFWGLTLIWACFIHLVGHFQPQCISVGGANYTEAGDNFMDAYQLSWTTFSTVGYGLVYPQLAIDDGARCFGVNLLATLEAFMGLLFASMIGAILFSKITRHQSFAPTLFSDPLVIRYGSGVKIGSDDDDDEEDEASREFHKREMPCPVLEFRVVNRMHSVARGEILNAGINVVASILEKDATDIVRLVEHHSHAKRHRFKSPKFMTMPQKQLGKLTKMPKEQIGKLTKKPMKQIGRMSATIGKTVPTETMGRAARNLRQSIAAPFSAVPEGALFDPDDDTPKTNYASTMEAVKQHRVMDEGDGSARLVPRRVFSTLPIETPGHPFFKRVWNVQHVLDENSPLLSAHAKHLIQENRGFWPEELNNCKAIREHVKFHQIIVNFSGTSNATGSTVYSQHVYDYVDLNVGFRFAGVLTSTPEGRITVDMALVNDVTEQNGGGAEPFQKIANQEEFPEAAEKLCKAASQLAATQKAANKFLATLRKSTAQAASKPEPESDSGGIGENRDDHIDLEAGGLKSE